MDCIPQVEGSTYATISVIASHLAFGMGTSWNAKKSAIKIQAFSSELIKYYKKQEKNVETPILLQPFQQRNTRNLSLQNNRLWCYTSTEHVSNLAQSSD